MKSFSQSLNTNIACSTRFIFEPRIQPRIHYVSYIAKFKIISFKIQNHFFFMTISCLVQFICQLKKRTDVQNIFAITKLFYTT